MAHQNYIEKQIVIFASRETNKKGLGQIWGDNSSTSQTNLNPLQIVSYDLYSTDTKL